LVVSSVTDIQDISDQRELSLAFALSLNPSLSELSDIKTAVSEAVTNCIVHAYKGAGGKFTIECRIEKTLHGGILHIDVTDNGCGIEDVERAVAPFYTTLEDDERSGMGFTVMQTFSTFFKVESELGKGTRVSMQKAVGM
jgi:stage II sporulation protein AB (anti-sigma F factor)